MITRNSEKSISYLSKSVLPLHSLSGYFLLATHPSSRPTSIVPAAQPSIDLTTRNVEKSHGQPSKIYDLIFYCGQWLEIEGQSEISQQPTHIYYKGLWSRVWSSSNQRIL